MSSQTLTISTSTDSLVKSALIRREDQSAENLEKTTRRVSFAPGSPFFESQSSGKRNITIMDEKFRAVEQYLTPSPSQCFAEKLQKQHSNGKTIFHLAAQKGYANLILRTLEQLSDEEVISLLERQDKDGYTPLHVMMRKDLVSVVLKISEKISKDAFEVLLMMPDNFGANCLHHSLYGPSKKLAHIIVEKVCIDTLAVLIQMRAFPRNVTPVYMAREQGLDELAIEMFLKSGLFHMGKSDENGEF